MDGRKEGGREGEGELAEKIPSKYTVVGDVDRNLSSRTVILRDWTGLGIAAIVVTIARRNSPENASDIPIPRPR